MPPRKQPPALKDAALAALIRMVTYQVRVLMTASAQCHDHTLRCVSEAVDALVSLPAGLRGGLVNAVLRCVDPFFGYRHHHPARRALSKLLGALLPPSTRLLDLTLADSYILREDLLRHLHALRDLRELTVSDDMRARTNVDLVVAALRTQPHLTVLRAPWFGYDDMAVTLAAHCPMLELLDVVESVRLTDRGTDALAEGCPRLRVLLLTGCRVSPRGYEKLLARLPLLRNVGRCPSLGGVVRAVGRPLALTEWDSDHVPDAQEAALCPSLATMSLGDVLLLPASDEDVEQDEKQALLPAGIQRLRVERAGLRDHPRAVRLQLRSLTHLDVREPLPGLDAVVELGRQCVGLRVLHLAVQPAAVMQAVPVHAARHAPFRELHELHVYSGPGPVLEYVLVHARALRRVTVETTSADAARAVDEAEALGTPLWTDAVVRRVMAVNPLAALQHWALDYRCALTMDSVYALILGCPDLDTLLDLTQWNVTETQIDELRELAAVNNWALQLDPVLT